jgi:hypothetical protein
VSLALSRSRPRRKVDQDTPRVAVVLLQTSNDSAVVVSALIVGFFLHLYHQKIAIEGGTHPNQIVDQQIKQAVDSQLAAKGLTKTDNDKADLYVGYQIAVDQEKQWNAFGMGGARWGGMGSGIGDRRERHCRFCAIFVRTEYYEQRVDQGQCGLFQ